MPPGLSAPLHAAVSPVEPGDDDVDDDDAEQGCPSALVQDRSDDSVLTQDGKLHLR